MARSFLSYRRVALCLLISFPGVICVLTVHSQEQAQVGYAVIETDEPGLMPVSSALFSYRNAQGVLVSEAGVEAVEPIRRGRIFVDGSVSTGLALANALELDSTIQLTLRSSEGATVSIQQIDLPAGQHTARFVRQLFHEYPLSEDFTGSLTFEVQDQSSEGVAAVTVRQSQNGYGEPIFATLPVAALDAARNSSSGLPPSGIAAESLVFPQVGAAASFTTQIILFNPTTEPITGQIELFGPSGEALELELEGVAASRFPYMLSPNGVFKGTLTTSQGALAGYAVVTPATNSPAPAGTAIFQYRDSLGKLISEAGVAGSPSTPRARMFVDTFQTQTGVAIAVPENQDFQTTLTFRLLDRNGEFFKETTQTLPAGGHLAIFVDQLFPGLPSGFSGVLEVVGSRKSGMLESDAPFRPVTLKLSSNDRGDSILTTLPVADLTRLPDSSRRIIPQIGIGLGFSTRLILVGGPSESGYSGRISLIRSDGSGLITDLGGIRDHETLFHFPAGGARIFRPGNTAAPVELILDPQNPQAREMVVNAGNQLSLRPLIFDENGEIRDDYPLQYLSLDQQVAGVAEGGSIQGEEPGFSTLTVHVGDLVQTSTITVVGVHSGAPGYGIGGMEEEVTGGLFMTSPSSHTLLRAESITSTPQVFAGMDGQAGLHDDLRLKSLFNEPRSLALDQSEGVLYVADRRNHVIRKVPLAGGVAVETIAGDGVAGFRDGVGSQARFRNPSGLALDERGGLWISDTGNHTVRRLDLAGGQVTTIAGSAGKAGFRDGTGEAARFDQPTGLDVVREPLSVRIERQTVGQGPPPLQIVVADSGNDAVRFILEDGTVSTLAAGREREPTGVAPPHPFQGPRAVASDPFGNLYVSEASGEVVTALADGSLVQAAQSGTFKSPADLVITESGKVLTADSESTGRELVYGTPVIGMLSPNRVEMAGGQLVTISGRNFPPDTRVVLDGHILEDVQVLDTSTIRFTSPALTSGRKTLTVQNRGGIAQSFLSVPPPSLAELDPGEITTAAGGSDYTGDGGAATTASLFIPTDVAVVGDGSYYIADMGNHRIRRVDAATSIITSVAGTGTPDNGPDGSLAVTSALNHPFSVELGPAGNLYLGSGNQIRRLDVSSGILTTIAGNGGSGFDGDGGPATSATLWGPRSFRFDSQGNLYFVDLINARVRKITPDGTINTILGTGLAGTPGYDPDDLCPVDGEPALEADLWVPEWLAIDSNDVVYVSDLLCGAVYRIDQLNQTVETYVTIDSPFGIDFDPDDNLVVVSRNQVFRVDRQTLQMDLLIGEGPTGFSGDGGPGPQARLNEPTSVRVGPGGLIYLLDSENNRLRRYDPSTDVIDTIAGIGSGVTGDGGPATDSLFIISSWLAPNDVEFDDQDNLYVAATGSFRVRKIDANGVITTFTGMATDDSTPEIEAVITPIGLALDPLDRDSLLVSERGAVRTFDLSTKEVGTIVGGGPFGFTPDGEVAAGGSFQYIWDMTFDLEGNLVICETPLPLSLETTQSLVRRVDRQTNRLTTLAGVPGTGGFSGDGGPATQAQLNFPTDAAFDSEGNLYIADSANHRVRRVDAATGIITTFAGGGEVSPGDQGYLATEVYIPFPSALLIDANDVVYIAARDDRIRRVDPSSGMIDTVAGSGITLGDGGPANQAQLKQPLGMTFDRMGNIFVADSQNARIRAIKLPLP